MSKENINATHKRIEIKNEEIDNIYCNPAVLASLWGVDIRRVHQLANEGIADKIEKGVYTLKSSTVKYAAMLRESAQGKTGEKKREQAEAAEQGYNVEIERARYYAASAREKELKNAREERELIPIEEVRHYQIQLQTVRNSVYEAIPSRICNKLARMTDPAEIRQELQKEMRRLRSVEAAKYLEIE